MDRIQAKPQAVRTEAPKLETYQTVMLGKFMVSPLSTKGIFKPSVARNISFFFRSALSFGSRHAEIVLEDKTSRVDRRMAKFLNVIADKASTPSKIERAWAQLQRATVDLSGMADVRGYEQLAKKAQTEDADLNAGPELDSGHDANANAYQDVGVRPNTTPDVRGARQSFTNKHYFERVNVGAQDKVQNAFIYQLLNLQARDPKHPLSPEKSPTEYLEKLNTLTKLLTSENAVQLAGRGYKTQGGNDRAIGDFVRSAVKQICSEINVRFSNVAERMDGTHLASLNELATNLKMFVREVEHLDRENMGGGLEYMTRTGIEQATKEIDQVLVKLSTDALSTMTTEDPQFENIAKSSVESLHAVSKRQGIGGVLTDLQRSVAAQLKEGNSDANDALLRNVAKACQLASVEVGEIDDSDVSQANQVGKLELGLADDDEENLGSIKGFSKTVGELYADSFVKNMVSGNDLEDVKLEDLNHAATLLRETELSFQATLPLEKQVEQRFEIAVKRRAATILLGIVHKVENTGSRVHTKTLADTLYAQAEKYGRTANDIDNVLRKFAGELAPEIRVGLLGNLQSFAIYENDRKDNQARLRFVDIFKDSIPIFSDDN
ncbi:MAG: hypothetical protein ACRYGK_12995 [Janthinobacterium lividum]